MDPERKRQGSRPRRNLVIPLAMVAALAAVFVSAVPASAAVPSTVSKGFRPYADSFTCKLTARSLGYFVGSHPTSDPGTMRYRASVNCGSRLFTPRYVMVTGVYFKNGADKSTWVKYKKKFGCGPVHYCAARAMGEYFGPGTYCAYAYTVWGQWLNQYANYGGTAQAGPACVKMR